MTVLLSAEEDFVERVREAAQRVAPALEDEGAVQGERRRREYEAGTDG